MDHRVMLTGASGTLGRNILELVAAGSDIDVLALLRPESRAIRTSQGVAVERVDLSDSRHVHEITATFAPTCIVHCAATGMEFPRSEWFDLLRVNIDMAVNFCELAARMSNCHFIHVSTGLAYRRQDRPLVESDPLGVSHPYGASKAAADILVHSAASEFGVPLTVLRPFSFTGLGDDNTRLFGSLLRAADAGKAFDLSPCEHVRDHCSARDIAEGILTAVRTCQPTDESARVFNLGSGNDAPLRNVIESVVHQLALDIDLRFGARALRPFEPEYLVADITLAGAQLGWQPTHNLAHAVWQLARDAFPRLEVTEPDEHLEGAIGCRK
jgi:UDP-glucose 4-epimerase